MNAITDVSERFLPTPADRFGPLLDEVQRRRLFGDGKTFVDAVPRFADADIMAAFEQVEREDGALCDFVACHFTLPDAAAVHEARPGDNLRDYIRSLWPDLVRAPTGPAGGNSFLPVTGPFVVPGGRFTELYYWDSYFSLLGLVRDGHGALARSMIEAFTHLIEEHGHIPNGTRTYYLSRSQPPMYFAMLDLLPDTDPRIRRRHLAAMIAEHAYWMRGSRRLSRGGSASRVVRMPDGAILNRHWDDRDTPRDESYAEDLATAADASAPAREVFRALRAGAESGWDFSSRWLATGGALASIRTQWIVPVDLNALLYGLECTIARYAEDLCDDAAARQYRKAASRRRAAICRWLWSPDGYFTDFDLAEHAIRPGITAATMAPLFTGVATAGQAAQVARSAQAQLLAPGGLRTTTIETGEQWDRPNGWAPLQWMAFRGLRRYGHAALADEIAHRWIAVVEDEFQASGAVHEKYDIEQGGRGHGGEYVPQVGFGWTNGVTAAFMDLRQPQVSTRQRTTLAEVCA